MMRVSAIHYVFFLTQGVKAFAPFGGSHINNRPQACSKSRVLKSVNGLDNVNGVNGDASAGNMRKLEEVCQESLEQYEEVMEFFMFELGNDIIFLENEVETSNFIQNNFDAILFDRDGVFCRGDDAIPEVVRSLKSLIKSDKEIFFMDDSEASASVAAELNQILDIDDLTQDQIISSTDRLKFDPSRVLFITDRMDSVVKSAKEGGMKSALVLTGNTTSDKLIEVSSSAGVDATLPHIIFPVSFKEGCSQILHPTL